MKNWGVPLALLPVLATPYLWAPTDGRAWPFGLLLYAVALVAWVLLKQLAPERLRGAFLGAISGLLVAYLLTPVLHALAVAPAEFGDSLQGRAILTLFLYLTVLVVGAALGAEKFSTRSTGTVLGAEPGNAIVSGAAAKLCDTSVLIDGRLAEMADAGFIEGDVLIPQFILRELQNIADSSEQLKRNRGRRGLDIVKKLQEIRGIHVSIPITDYADEREVDHKLIRLASDENAILITNDFNLNKVARVRGIKVLNLNDLVNALKTIFLPGEEIVANITRSGKETGQGVAYLDDGTMIVIDGGGTYVGKQARVVVTNIHQTTAGRMIFTRFESLVSRKGEPDERSV